VARGAEVACSHVSGLLMQSGWTAGPDGVREPRPHHSNGIDVPTRRQASLGCVGSTDFAITRHCSLASSSVQLSSLSRRGHTLVILLPVHHRPGDPRRLVRQRHRHDQARSPAPHPDHPGIGIGRLCPSAGDSTPSILALRCRKGAIHPIIQSPYRRESVGFGGRKRQYRLPYAC